MKYKQDFTRGWHPPGLFYEDKDIKVVNFVCDKVEKINNHVYQIFGTTLDKKEKIKFFIDKMKGGCSLFAPGYSFTIDFFKHDDNLTWFIVNEQIYNNEKDCRLCINENMLMYEDEKQFVNRPYNTFRYFELGEKTPNKKYYGKQQ